MKITGRPPKLTPEQKASLICLHRAGVGRAELAARFNVCEWTVYSYVRGDHKNPALVAVAL